MREIVLDTETTGLDPRSGDRLVEIGCVELMDHFPSGKTWHTYLNPERDVPGGAMRVHGLSSEFLSDKPLFGSLAEDFLEFIGDATLVIHNASFDIGFLNHELAVFGHAAIQMTRVIDTLAIAREKHPGAQNNLDALCRRYGIDNSSRTLHGALLDSEILAEVYLELIGGHQANLDLMAQSGGERAGDTGPGTGGCARKRAEPLAPRLSKAEIAAHRTFVETMGGDAIWWKYVERGEQ